MNLKIHLSLRLLSQTSAMNSNQELDILKRYIKVNQDKKQSSSRT